MKLGLQMIIIVIMAAALLFLGLLVRNVIHRCRNDKWRARIYIFGGIVAFLAFPLLINAIITERLYIDIPIRSEMRPSEWFGFWGSYIGSLVAILLGWIAYQQTELSNKQNEQVQEQQRQINHLVEIANSYQLKPRITIPSFSME